MAVTFIVLMTSCSGSHSTQYKYQELKSIVSNGNDVIRLYDLELPQFTITKDNKNMVVVVYDSLIKFYITHIFVFSPERKLADYVTFKKNIPIEPVTVEEDLNNFISWDCKDIKEKCGEFHYLEGVGNEYGDMFFSPCYFSKDGYCVVFTIENGKIQGVYRYDLINEEIVEEYGENEKWLG